MAILKFRVFFEDDDSIYRDVAIRHEQSFFELHEAILRAYEFDNKHKATFFAVMTTGSGEEKFRWKYMSRIIKCRHC